MKSSTTGQHHAFGKVILFGEHFVVYGVRAIVAAVTEYTSCALTAEEGGSGLVVIDNRPAVPGYKVEKRAEQEEAHSLVLKHLHIDLSRTRLIMTLGGPLVPTSGIGASASDVVSFSRALNEMYGLNMSEAQINASGYAGEMGYHGTPSGIDNTAATYGGLLVYQRGKDGAPPKFDSLRGSCDMHVIVIATGITSSTTKVVGAVKDLKDANEAQFAEWLGEYENLTNAAVAAIEAGDIVTLGALMNKNHTLCQAITVSCAELDTIVTRARGLGAVGAKMSGTGRGGIAVALCRDAASQAVVAEGLSKIPEAKFVWQYTVRPSLASNL